ncbi:unnamed protein product [Rotaria magnacalcarata]|uniref:U-box domain-containing protein n=3 Tax=Rotaria magnacalcarata TaxID=392030 RepID=A0A814WUB0_9BILA|nr:unnamed protein product [Rotaria magnacalcarata]CAF1684101.1 unnamed protein product [Rotaria magnacalcarata]CAF3767084.1 unnamed protein product [Rotaria magnacalcarata]CAF3834848.1 unnamed protein product [Rotaria magnacalcarata]
MDEELSLDEIISYAREFQNFEKVFSAVYLHPNWLTTIPPTRRWAILHHIVLSGNTVHFDQILPSQKSNAQFRLLTKTADQETILDIAKSHVYLSDMLKRIERLIKLDELLNYAKEGKWDQCIEIVKQNPSYGNEKPPYRRFYLIHHLAYSNAVEAFKEFLKIENFQFSLLLRVDGKKVNDIAREAKCEAFANFIEKDYAAFFDDDDDDDVLYEPSAAQSRLDQHDANIIIVPHAICHEPKSSCEPEKKLMNRAEVNKLVPRKSKPINISNIPTRYSSKTILNLLTCSLTRATVTDPVVAADGFTYERTAIENWLKANDCSPMTNEKLAHKDLTSNVLVKRLLDAITQ